MAISTYCPRRYPKAYRHTGLTTYSSATIVLDAVQSCIIRVTDCASDRHCNTSARILCEGMMTFGWIGFVYTAICSAVPSMPVRCCPSPFKPALPLPSTTETFTSDICFCQTYLKGLRRHVIELQQRGSASVARVSTEMQIRTGNCSGFRQN